MGKKKVMWDDAVSSDEPGLYIAHDLEILQPSQLVLQKCFGIFDNK